MLVNVTTSLNSMVHSLNSPEGETNTAVRSEHSDCSDHTHSTFAPITCFHRLALLQLVGHVLGQHGVQQVLRLPPLLLQVLRQEAELLLLPLQLTGQLHLGQSLLVEQDEVAGDVVGRDVRNVHVPLLQLLKASQQWRSLVEHTVQRGHPDHLTCMEQTIC